MKYFIQILIPTILLFSCQSAPEFNIEDWPETSWRMNTSDSAYQTERWVRMNDQLMIGSTLLIERNGKDTSILEEMRLSVSEEGVVFVPLVTGHNNNQEVEFKLTKANGKKFEFENAEHDSPQKIVYDFKNKDILQASIFKSVDDNKAAQTFMYERE